MCENPSSRACSEDTKTVRFIAITTCSGGGVDDRGSVGVRQQALGIF